MADNDSSSKQPWLVPVIVAIVGTLGTVGHWFRVMEKIDEMPSE